MDADLAEAVRKRQIADALTGGDDTDSSDTTDTTETDSDQTPEPAPEQQVTGQQPANPNAQSLSDYPAAKDATAPIELPAVTVTGEEPVSVAMASREMAKPPEGYGVAPRAELVSEPDQTAPGEPAPDKLTQVERAELVKLPDQVQPAPDKLTQVERAQPVTAVTPVTPVPVTQTKANPNAQSLDDYQVGQVGPVGPVAPRALPPGAAPPVQRAQPVPSAEPAITEQAAPGSFTPVDGQRTINGVILHSADGSSVKSDVNTLTGGDPDHKVSVHYYVERDGTVHHFISDNDIGYHAGATSGPNAGYNNSNTIGIETEHVDGKDNWPEAQVRAEAQIAAREIQTHGLSINDVLGHSDIAPERKQDPLDFPWDKFRGYVQQYLAQQPGAPAAPGAPAVARAEPATKTASGFYQNEDPKSFITGRATTFATPDDVATFNATAGAQGDSGVGAPRLGRLDTTQTAGVAVPEDVLQSTFGNSPAAWRKARVDVVDPSTGKRLRLPIVDLGPGNPDALFDMTPTVSKFFGGDKNLSVKLVANAGPDVTKNPQSWNDEQAAIKEGFDSSTLQPGAVTVAPKYNYREVPADPRQSVALAQADAFNQQNQRQALADLEEQNKDSPVGLFKRLDQPVEGVSDSMRKEFQGNLKTEITKYAQDYYGIKDPAEAFAKATSDADFGTVASDIWRKIPGAYGQLDVALNQASQSSDANALDRFARVLHPEATPEGRTAFVKTLTDIKDPDVRSQTIGKLWAEMEPQKQASIDINGLVGAADNVASPEYQAAQNQAIATKKAWIDNQLRSDPRLSGTLGGFIADQGAQFLPNVTMALLPPGIRESAFAAQIYSQAKDEFRHDHPDWTDAQLNDAAGKSTVLQLGPQELLQQAIGGKLGALTRGISQPALRIGASALAHTGLGAGGGALQQVAANIAAGRPAMEGVGAAAGAGAIQAAPAGVVAGLEGRAPVTEERPPVRTEPPPVTVPREEPTAPSVTEERPPVTEEAPPPAPTAAPQVPVTQEDVARRAYEISEERARSGQPGDHLSDWHQAQQELSQATEPITPVTVSEAEPINSAIANRYTQDRMAAGTLGEVVPGQGVSTEALLARGLRMGPEEINQHVSDVVNRKGGDPVLQAAAVRAEEARLSQRSNAASRAAEADPSNVQLRTAANDAFNDLTDFHKGPVAEIKRIFHGTGMGLQGEIPVDLSNFNGQREAFLKNFGKAPPAEMEPVLRKSAKAVTDAAEAEKMTMNNLGKEIEKTTRGKSLPTDEQIRTKLMDIMKDLPCP